MTKQRIAIYLAGTIKKRHEQTNDSCWTDVHMQELSDALPQYKLLFLNPAFRTDDMTDHQSVFGRDMTQVFCSDFVLADVRERRGLGVGAEMMWAKVHRIPLICWAPDESHYNCRDTTILDCPVEHYIHPFVACLSDHIAPDLADAAAWMAAVASGKHDTIKDLDHVSHMMRHYRHTQFPRDLPMQELWNDDPRLENKLKQKLRPQESS